MPPVVPLPHSCGLPFFQLYNHYLPPKKKIFEKGVYQVPTKYGFKISLILHFNSHMLFPKCVP